MCYLPLFLSRANFRPRAEDRKSPLSPSLFPLSIEAVSSHEKGLSPPPPPENLMAGTGYRCFRARPGASVRLPFRVSPLVAQYLVVIPTRRAQSYFSRFRFRTDPRCGKKEGRKEAR